MKGLLAQTLDAKPDIAISLLMAEKKVMEMIAVAEPLTKILTTIALNYESHTEGGICSILLLDEEGKQVRHGAGPSLPEAFNNGIDGEPIGPVAGSCGTAAFTKERVIVSDIANDPLWINYRDFAISFGLKACWSTPILTPANEVLGTFAIYYKECRRPTEQDLELIDRATSQVKIALERDRKEEQLRKSEESLRKSLDRTIAISNAIPDLNFVINKDGVIVDYQNQIGVTTFKKPEEFLGRKLETVLPPELASAILKNVKDVLNHTEVPVHYYQLSYPDGPRDFEARYVRMNDNEVLAIVRDLTKEKQVEIKIKISEEKFRLSLDRITDGFASIDKEWRITYINEKCGQLLQRDPEKVIGKKVFDEFPELHNQPWHKSVEKAMKEQKYVFLEDFIENIDRWFEDHIYPSPEGVSIYFRDITRKKRFEKERIEKELQFRKLTDNVPVAIFQTDLYGHCSFVNPTWCSYSGMKFEEAMGFNWTNAIHPDDRARVLEEWQSSVSTNKEFKTELRFRHRNGEVFWLDVKAVVVADPEGNIYGHIGMAVDISERKKVVSIIEESEARYRSTLERITDGFVALDNNWCYTYMNKTAAQIFNRDPEKIIGKHIWAEFPEGVGQPFHGAYLNAMLEQEYEYLEEYYPPYDKWFENHIYPSRQGLSIYFKDITERKKAEEKIKESEERFRSVVEQSLTGVYVIQGDYFAYVNPKFAKIFGYSHDKMLKNFKAIDVVYEPDRKLVSDTVNQRLEGKAVDANYHFRGIKQNGEIIHVEVFGSTAVQGGQQVTIGSLLDITDKKAMEQDLAESEQRLRTILDTEPECVKVLNRKGELVDMNPAGLAMIEADSLDIVKGKKMATLVVESYRQAFENLARNVFEGKSGKLEFEITGLKGGKKWLETHSVPLRDMAGDIISLLGVTRDITERKLQERERFALLHRNRQTITTMLDGFILADVMGNIIEVNPAYCCMVGYSIEELQAMNINELEVLSTKKEIEERIATMMQKKSLQFETKHERKDKKMIDLEVSVAIMKIDEESFVAAFVRNITEKKKAREELKESHEDLRKLAAHLDAVREEERAALSRELHDELGQQLTAIKMDLSWVNKHIKNDGLAESKIEGTIKVVNEAVATVRRINSDLRPAMLEDLGLFSALEYQINEFSRRFNAVCDFKIEMPQPKLERAREVAIFRVFQEALTNVARHAAAKHVSAHIREVSGEMELIIKDDGIGFDRTQVGKIKSFGLLGMTERAMMLSGSLEIDSTPGEGTTLRLVVPIE